ncbi:unnamed protein product [Chrysoparadoxa australica]
MVMMDACKDGERIDWETIHGLMVDAIYGGRVDNTYDMRVLTTYLAQMFTGAAIGADGKGKPLIRDVAVPRSDDLSDFTKLISKLPDTDSPAIFGLPESVERSVQRTASEGVIQQLRHLSIASLEGSKFQREQWRERLGPIIESWDKLAASSPDIKKKGPRRLSKTGQVTHSDMDPVDAFVVMEEASASELCSMVDHSLGLLKKVVYGTALLTPQVHALGTALMANELPGEWTKSWEGPEAPLPWLAGLIRKKSSLAKWSSLVAQRALLDHPVNLSDLFHPNTFLSAVRQQTARLIGCSMDSLHMVSSWERGRVKNAQLPISVEGLHLQGASFSSGMLQEQGLKDPDLTSMPEVSLAFVEGERSSPYQAGQAIPVPLYFTLNRERTLAEVDLPTSKDPERWVLAGVALFLSD